MDKIMQVAEKRRPRVERLALEFARFAHRLEPVLLPRAPAYNTDLQKCAASILANFGEAWDEPSPGDKAKFFRYAHRSAGEAERLLRGLTCIRVAADSRIDEGMRLLLAIKMDLVRLLNSLGR